jgi:hypothetical protein
MCTTSAECRTVMTVVLTVMSGMDPHMSSWKPGMGLAWLVVLVSHVLFRSIYRIGLCGMVDVLLSRR